MPNKISENPLARTVLEMLLRSANASSARGGASRPASRNFERPDHEYWALDVEARQAFHAELSVAAAGGAVEVEWSRFGGDDKVLKSVRVRDLGALANFLELSTHQARIDDAAAILSPWMGQVPRLHDVLNAWRQGKAVRRYGPEGADGFAAAARVIVHMRGQPGEAAVRVVSRQLFRDSKYIEGLIPHLDVLCADVWQEPASHREHVLSRIGLRTAPLPFLMAGCGSVRLRTSGSRVLAYEYLAVTPGEVVGFCGTPLWVLCIENLTTFGLAAHAMGHAPRGLLLYTGGMPSPSWRRACVALLHDIDSPIPVYHWGDIDEGGYRIAAVIAQTISPRPLVPWLMDPSVLSECDSGTDVIKGRMIQAARRAGWEEIARRIAAMAPVVLEQEQLEITLPE